MILAFGAGENFLDVIKSTDATRAKIEAAGAIRLANGRSFFERRQTGTQDFVYHDFERAMLCRRFQLHRDIIVEGQRRPHVLMLSI